MTIPGRERGTAEPMASGRTLDCGSPCRTSRSGCASTAPPSLAPPLRRHRPLAIGPRGSAALAVLSLTAVLAAAPARAQLSPGPLAEAHRALDGATQCFQCHASGAGVVDAKCLACHTEIGWLRVRGRGLHARVGTTACAKCHPEHAGRGFQLVRWDEGSPQRFDHRRAGFSLEGRHASLACRQCHAPRFQKSGAAPLIRQEDHARSWLGLETPCGSCHEDPHGGEEGADCRRCHDQEKWKPAPGFDHARTRYPLTGKHVSLACSACHPAAKLAAAVGRGAASVAAYGSLRFAPVAHADCASCHRDPHAGRFTGACARCHVTTGFHDVNQRDFDHDRTRFALRGKHATLACARCHDPKTAWGEKPPFERCAACHPDAHAGQATLAGRAADCAACHDERGWTPSTFTAAAHQTTAYPLEGRHASAACASCHLRSAEAGLGTSRVLLRPPHAQCADCHADPHRGRYAAGGARAQAGGCRACHTLDRFVPSTVTAASHARLGFALEGAHLAAACRSCHSDLDSPRPASSLKGAAEPALFVAETPAGCTDCHADPHRGRYSPGGARPQAEGCRACHSLAAFSPATIGVSDHSGYGFALEGAHRAVPCLACHKDLAAPRAASSLRDAAVPALFVTALPTGCADCHASPHGAQFAGRPATRAGLPGDACEACHDLQAFAPAGRFDHERDAAFHLRGAHARVACGACHPTARDAAGRAYALYRPTPERCEDCHAVRQTPKGPAVTTRPSPKSS